MVFPEGSWSRCREAPEPSLQQAEAARGRGATRTRGFTMIEILLALAVIGLMAAAVTSISWHLVGDKRVTPDEVFWEASREARKTALKNEHEVRLSYDGKEKNFVVTDGASTKTFPLPPIRDLTVDFLPAQQGRSAVLIGGQLVDTRSIPSVAFYSDGTCMPFRVQFRSGGPARVLSIDPWTCAEVISDKDNDF